MFRVLATLAALCLAGCSSCDGGPVDGARGDTPPAPSAAPSPSSHAAPDAAAPARPMLVQLTRDFCLPCQEMKPSVTQLRQEAGDVFDVAVVNVDRPQHRPFAVHFAATSVPTQIYLDAAGAVVARHEGLASLEELRTQLARLGWRRP